MNKAVTLTFRSAEPNNERAVEAFLRAEYPGWSIRRSTIRGALGSGPAVLVGDLWTPVALAAQANDFWAVGYIGRPRELLLMRLGVRLIEEREVTVPTDG